MADKPHWLDQERFTVYPRIILVLMGGFVLLRLFGHAWFPWWQGIDNPLATDFLAFWSASHLALSGHPAAAYDVATIFATEKAAVPGNAGIYPWMYPPAFYLVVLPLALLPYAASFAVFMLAGIAGYVLVFRRIARHPAAMWCLAAFPGGWITLAHGQNAFLSAALAAAALLSLERRPVLGGFLIGLLAIKPQLAILFPVALIALGAWRAFLVAALTAVLFNLAGVAVLGGDIVEPALHGWAYARRLLEQGGVPWAKMPSAFVLLRTLHMPVGWAYGCQGAVSVLAAGTVWRIWRHCPDWTLRGAALMTATFLATPYGFDYDFTWLAFPLVWMALAGVRDGWLAGEREVLVAVWALPLYMAVVAIHAHLPVGFALLATLLWMIARRAQRAQRARWARSVQGAEAA